MKLFGKKKETKSCCCGGNCTSETMQNAENKKQEQGIKILGSGCAKCMELEKATRTATSELQLVMRLNTLRILQKSLVME